LTVLERLRTEWARRPWWMNLIFLFCLYMTFVYMPFDLFFKPIERDEEVWFGVVLHGTWAKATEPLHWAIYAALAWGFWKMRAWMWPWAAVYVAQVAIGMLVWNLLDPRGQGWLVGAIAAAVFLVPTIALWRSRTMFASSGSRSPA
jgi:hypothetical protein